MSEGLKPKSASDQWPIKPLYDHPAPATVESLPYQLLFNAIAAATDIASGGLAVSISVEKFRAALAPATEGRKG